MRRYVRIFSEDAEGNIILNPQNPNAKKIFEEIQKIPKPILVHEGDDSTDLTAYITFVNDNGKRIIKKMFNKNGKKSKF